MKILFVDADAGALAERVGREGFAECFAATDAESAVEIVNREDGVDVLVTDVFLGEVDGFALDETLRQYLPDLQTVFLSAYDLSEYAERVGSTPVVGKPVDADALAAYFKEAVGIANDPLVGGTVGLFRIDARTGTDESGPVYAAMQTNISREVELHVLDTSRGEPERFLSDASLKANVRHPAVLAVFEAGEADGVYFYAAEPPQGTPLSRFVEEGRHLEASDVLQLLQTVGEVMVQFSETGISRGPLESQKILIDHRNRARMHNVATSQPVEFSVAEELREIGRVLNSALARGGQIGPLLQLLDEMGIEDGSVRTWAALLHEVKRRAPQSAPTRTIALDASGRAAIAAVGASRRKQRIISLVRAVLLIALVLGVAAVAWWYFSVPSGIKLPSEMTQVPAGVVSYENGKRVDVPGFWIDDKEVSIAEYAEFLAWIVRHSGEMPQFESPDMPQGKSHIPDGWTGDGIKPGFYEIAKQGGVYEGKRIGLSSPVFNVDWFDAYAFAYWRGRRLPSDEEWELLTVGPGAEANMKKVKGLDGNVSEWTNTWVETPDGVRSPIIRGGDASALDVRRKVSNGGPLQRKSTIGFRTASEQPPPQ